MGPRGRLDRQLDRRAAPALPPPGAAYVIYRPLPSASVSGISITYSGSDGDAPAIVLGHGCVTDLAMFEPQVAALTLQYRVITWDQRGRGGTKATGAFSYRELCPRRARPARPPRHRAGGAGRDSEDAGLGDARRTFQRASTLTGTSHLAQPRLPPVDETLVRPFTWAWLDSLRATTSTTSVHGHKAVQRI